MNIKNILTTAMLAALPAAGMAQQSSVHFDMTVIDGALKESVSNGTFTIVSQLPALSVAGVSGEAMRFDGYSNYVKAKLTNNPLSTTNLTINIILAPETFPMMNTAEAENTPTYATVFGNLDETAKKGFAIKLSSQGHLRFTFASAYAKGYLFTIDSSEKLPLGRWSQITAVLNKDANLAALYLKMSGSGRVNFPCADRHGTASLRDSPEFFPVTVVLKAQFSARGNLNYLHLEAVSAAYHGEASPRSSLRHGAVWRIAGLLFIIHCYCHRISPCCLRSFRCCHTCKSPSRKRRHLLLFRLPTACPRRFSPRQHLRERREAARRQTVPYGREAPVI